MKILDKITFLFYLYNRYSFKEKSHLVIRYAIGPMFKENSDEA